MIVITLAFDDCQACYFDPTSIYTPIVFVFKMNWKQFGFLELKMESEPSFIHKLIEIMQGVIRDCRVGTDEAIGPSSKLPSLLTLLLYHLPENIQSQIIEKLVIQKGFICIGKLDLSRHLVIGCHLILY